MALLTLAAAAAGVLTGACNSRRYVLGAVCPNNAAGTDPRCSSTQNVTFAVDLDKSGVSRLPAALDLPTGPVQPVLRLRGENATADVWTSDQGPRLARVPAAAAPRVQLPAPFTDGTRAVAAAPGMPAYAAESSTLGDVDGDDFVIEIVFRAPGQTVLLTKATPTRGWSLETGSAVMALHIRGAQGDMVVGSGPFVPTAWTHCLLWVTHAAGAWVSCNGGSGVMTPLGTFGDLTNTEMLTFGGASVDQAEVALFALYRVAPGLLGAMSEWEPITRRRFAELTGSRARLAGGDLLPKSGLRASAAYIDLDVDAALARRMFLVGENWPRIACRRDAAGARDCGYLSEPRRQRLIPRSAETWTKSGLQVASGRSEFPAVTGEMMMDGLVPTADAGPHELSVAGAFAGARQTFSFFGRAVQGRRVGATVGAAGMAVFDLRAGTVVSSPAGVTAAVDAWGSAVYRCTFTFIPGAGGGALTYAVRLLDDAGGAAFTGDGTMPWIEVAGLQLDVGQAYAGTLLGADDQAADTLTFVGDGGNLPATATGNVALRVLLPAGPRLTDQAVVSLNRGGSFDDQIQLYMRGDTSQLQFWGLRAGATDWTLVSSQALTDGLRHPLGIGWAATSAYLTIDGKMMSLPALINDATPFMLDRIDIGFSSSSGHLEGLVAGLQIGP